MATPTMSLAEALQEVARRYSDGIENDLRDTLDSYDVIGRRWMVSSNYVYKLARKLGLRRQADNNPVPMPVDPDAFKRLKDAVEAGDDN
jgi:hypothetical protein